MKTAVSLLIIVIFASGCRVVNIEVHAESGSTVIIDAELQADKPMDFKGGGLKIPFLP